METSVQFVNIKINSDKKLKRVILISDCCNHVLWSNSTICPKCKEWCKPVKVVKEVN